METDSCKHTPIAHHKTGRARRYFKVVYFVTIVLILGFWMDYWFRGEMGIAKIVSDSIGDRMGIGVLIGAGMLYVLLLSLPFVPGVELGVLLMCLFGKEGIIFVYFATVAGLNLAFLMGRILPLRWVQSLLEKLGVAIAIKRHFGGLDGMLKNTTVNHRLCNNRVLSVIAKYRYPVIGILFNTPGNYFIGGGGGISLTCGLSRNISWKWFLLTVVIAVLPVPLLAWFGVIQLETFLGIE
jgi:hypothetical protein